MRTPISRHRSVPGRTRHFHGVVWSLAASSALVLAGPAQALTIEEAMRRAATTHPSVAAEALEAEAADRDVGAAISNYFPTIAIDGSVRREHTERPSFENTLTANEYSLTVTQPLFDGLKTPAQVDAARSDADAATLEQAEALNDVSLEAASAYLAVLQAREQLEMFRDHERRARSIHERIEKRAQSDRGLRSLTVVGRSNIEEARFLVLDSERELALAEARYGELIGEAPDALSQPVDPLVAGAVEQDAVLAVAEKAHPALAAARSRAAAADGTRRAARAELLPRLDLELRARNGENIEGIEGPDDDYYAGLRLTYKFAVGGGDFYNLSAANYRERAAEMRINEVAREVRLNVLDALETYRSRSQTHSVLQSRLTAASELVKVYDAQFVAGRRDLLDLFFVLNEERTAGRAELNARYDTLRAAYTLLAATGELGPRVAAATDTAGN